jgi:hypothetical protein
MRRLAVAPGTITVFSDVICGWSTVALYRFYGARPAAGLEDRLSVDLRSNLVTPATRGALFAWLWAFKGVDAQARPPVFSEKGSPLWLRA